MSKLSKLSSCISIFFLAMSMLHAKAEDATQRSELSRTIAALFLQDASLNSLYQEVLSDPSPKTKVEIQEEQRKWISVRNSTCVIQSKETIAQTWLAKLDGVKAECVLQLTKERIDALAQYHSAKKKIDTFSSSDKLQNTNEFVFPIGHKTGKWYAEVTVDPLLVDRSSQKTFHVGVDNINGFYTVTNERNLGANEPSVIGLMVDLDRNYFEWRSASHQPSDAFNGVPLAQSDKPYTIKLSSSEPLQQWLDRGHIRINHGQKAFKYSLPGGYEPWEYSRGKNEPNMLLVPAYEKIFGLDHKETAMAFWNWLLNHKANQNPSTDRTGEQCAILQNFDFWFLAGADAADKVERKCTVPYGVNIVIPVMSLMLAGDIESGCKSTSEVAKLAPHTIQNSFIEIDGKRFDRLQDYAAKEFSCSELKLGDCVFAKYANWFGLWVPLRPLERGEHLITFGGRIHAINADRKVTYRITVK
jgi:uncharacterized protein YecT (DUF1311 family)